MNHLSSWVRHLTLSVAAVAAVAGCTDGDAATGAGGANPHLTLHPRFVNVTGAATAPINRIRVLATVSPGGAVLTTAVFDVAPADPEWKFALEVPITSPTRILVLVELLNVAGGIETVEWSGSIGPLDVAPGRVLNPPAVLTFPGPTDNLSVTAIVITTPPDLVEGESRPLSYTVQGGGPGRRVLFASLDPTIATVDALGVVRGLLPGTARIVATAGPIVSNTTVTVRAKPTSMTMSPSSIELTSIGATATFAARVLDARGADVPGALLTYSIADPTIATHAGAGQFIALRNGTTTITAEGPDGLRATSTLIVAQRVATIAVSPATRTLELGATAPFTAVAKDANGNTMTGVAFTWASTSNAVATVSAAGVVTGHATGSATITASAGGISGTANVTVVQTIAAIAVTPANVEFTCACTAQLTAVARTAAGAIVPNTTFSWTTSNAAVATVNTSGLVTAVAPGTATITAAAGGRTGTAAVVFHAANASLNGRVVSGASGAAVIGAHIELRRGETSAGSVVSVANGEFSFTGLTAGTYTVLIGANGFEDYTTTVEIAAGQAVTRVFIIEPTGSEGSATLTGRVLNGANGSGVPGANVELRLGGSPVRNVTADSEGNYAIVGVAPGEYVAVVTAPGFVTNSQAVSLAGGQTLEHSFTLLPSAPGDQVRIVLTWNENPGDLDSHLEVPASGSSGPTFVYYGATGSSSSYPFATLDTDETGGYGPETITIVQQLTGTYTYHVHHFSGSPGLTASGARVEVYRGDTQLASFLVPGTGTGDLWTVFTLNGTTLTPVNTIGSMGGVIGGGSSVRAPKPPASSSRSPLLR